MIKGLVWLGVVVVGVGSGVGQTGAGAGQGAAAGKKSCAVNRNPPNAAETAMNKGDHATAEKMLREMVQKDAKDDVTREELVRVLLRQDKVAEAAAMAEPWASSAATDSMALLALGEVKLRQGDVPGANHEYLLAAQADPCNARVYYAVAGVDGLAGMHASAKRLIEQAYVLHPSDDDIHAEWIAYRPRTERLALWTDYVEHSDQVSEENRGKFRTQMAKESLYQPTDCKAAPATPSEATVSIVAVRDGPERFLGWGLDVLFNGKRRRLQIDTGASGITISRAAAAGLGLENQDATLMGGVGEKGAVKTSVTHVASIKIGGIEFTNCVVEILEKWNVLDTDGLIGSDVFRHSVVTLDFPKHELRLGPLPQRPEEKAGATGGAAVNDDNDGFHNAYIAPEMAKWERVYRNGHDLLMPTEIVETKRLKEQAAWKDKLFLLDTGSFTNMVSPVAAREVTKVSKDTDVEVRGISGDVNKVFAAGEFTMAFAGLRLTSPFMTSIDTTAISRGAGVEVSGVIGAPALFQVVMHIDYRDNLVWCEYTPPK